MAGSSVSLFCLSYSRAGPVALMAQDYREEIIKYAIEPCLLASIRKNNLDKTLGEDQAMVLIKIMTKDNTEIAVRTLTPSSAAKTIQPG